MHWNRSLLDKRLHKDIRIKRREVKVEEIFKAILTKRFSCYKLNWRTLRTCRHQESNRNLLVIYTSSLNKRQSINMSKVMTQMRANRTTPTTRMEEMRKLPIILQTRTAKGLTELAHFRNLVGFIRITFRIWQLMP